ncbi:FAD-binding oxidoreductase [Mesorhizobium amorphae]|uniref:FAD linked oxidase domain-containing protein n=1 Tax=Mesorhizobium amorphae CCNWGS0123 TaxID=1082933 RepID=G6YLP1_9HYPH|nr:FAD-binding oxidoreductase [Mesorhizobium amorphae]ANT54109.1 FAD-dependent oxidoreductase [Mesorhizobium amorphae CCNWGS0123]EHH02636.1 FAD linked oxidase domain-containing protein [Mesorhizobium amorphae CCNWGS0123]
MTRPVEQLLSQLHARFDTASVLVGDAVDPRYSDDLSGKNGVRPELVLRPRTAAEVAEMLRLCNGIGQPLVVHGGRTGLAGAARVEPGEAVLSLERMTAIETPDREAATIVAEAGVPLQVVQDVADAAGLLFGVDIGARGTATVGGNVATNAGGIRVLRYGMYRAQVLGLEAVLADGSILTSLKGLPKDNSGYDLNQLFVGSEGTLGVVTRACLRLHPKPATEVNAFCALASLEAAIALLGLLRQRLGPLLSAYEVNFSPLYGAMVAGMQAPAPLPAGSPVYVLAEIQGTEPDRDGERFAAVLMQAVEEGVIDDVVVSQSPREFRALWDVREDANLFLFSIEGLVGVDISIPLARMAVFLRDAEAAIRTVDRNAEIYVFGHLGDGNLHYQVQTSEPALAYDIIYRGVAAAGGGVSAEHGIGLDKKKWLHLVRSEAEIAAMRRLKSAFDPNNILNPGRIFDAAPRGF